MLNTHSIQKLTLALSLTLGISQAAQAQSYLLFELGQARANTDVGHFNAYNQGIIESGGEASLSQSEQDRTWRLGYGYQLTPHWALEVGYSQLGKLDARSISQDTNDQDITRSRTVTETLEQNGWSLTGVGQYRIQQNWVLKGYGGLVWLSQKTEGRAQGQTTNATGSVIATESESTKQNEKKWVPSLAVSVGYQIQPNWQTQLKLERLFNVDPGVLGEFHLDTIKLGVNYQF